MDDSSHKVCDFNLNINCCLFEDNSDYTLVDFANKFIGGGVLNSGCVQEEVLFVLCPELIVSKLFTEKFLDNESMLITGAEKFNCYSGYADTFKWKSSYNDTTSRDKYGRRMRQVIAMDAMYFSDQSQRTQYERVNIDREIIKAICAFQYEPLLININKLPAIATGNWGCGAYHGDPYLKTMIQIIAASHLKRDLYFFTFNHVQLKDDFEQIKILFKSKPTLTIGQVYQYTLKYASLKQTQSQLDLYHYLMQHLL